MNINPCKFTLSQNRVLPHSGLSLMLAVSAIILTGCNDHDHINVDFQPYDVPNSVVVTDLDGDGKNDIAVAYTHIDNNFPNAGFVSTIIQSHSSAGTFSKGVDMAIGSNPAILAAGNLDEANGVDLVSANAYSNNVSVLLQGTTAGVFSAASNVTVGSTSTPAYPNSVAVGDVNGDGLADIAVADLGPGGNVYVMLQDSANHGHFLAPISLSVGNLVSSVAIADVNGDGLGDVVTASYDTYGSNGRVSVFIQNATTHGTFLTRVDYAAGAVPTTVKIADVNGDGKPDLIVADRGQHQAGNSGVSVLLQSATTAGTFLTPVTYATAYGSIDVAVGDLNGDGKPDLVVANLGGYWTGSISVLLQDPTQAGVYNTATNYPGVFGPLGVAIGDLNGDGKPDIAIADGTRAAVMFQSMTTAGTFAPPSMVGL